MNCHADLLCFLTARLSRVPLNSHKVLGAVGPIARGDVRVCRPKQQRQLPLNSNAGHYRGGMKPLRAGCNMKRWL